MPVYEIFRDWKDLIIKLYSEYPLAAALITVLGLAGFFLFEQKRHRSWKPTLKDTVVAFLLWIIAVPILGFVFIALVKIVTFLAATGSLVGRLLSFIYSVYEAHPLFILILIVLAVMACSLWHWRRPPPIYTNLWVKIVIRIAAFVTAVGIAAPIVNLFSPSHPTASDAKAQR